MISEENLRKAREVLQNDEIVTDGGMPYYMTEEPDDWSNFTSEVHVEVMGSILEKVEDGSVTGRRDAKEVTIQDSAMRLMEWREPLEANIINLEAWLHDHWLETVAIKEEMELEDGRIFLPDLYTAEVDIELDRGELIHAARQRAGEDSTHFLYVLGNWTYLAEKNDHVSSGTYDTLWNTFRLGREKCLNPPEDATTEEFGGGRIDT